jgi:hypothetical protein
MITEIVSSAYRKKYEIVFTFPSNGEDVAHEMLA